MRNGDACRRAWEEDAEERCADWLAWEKETARETRPTWSGNGGCRSRTIQEGGWLPILENISVASRRVWPNDSITCNASVFLIDPQRSSSDFHINRLGVLIACPITRTFTRLSSGVIITVKRRSRNDPLMKEVGKIYFIVLENNSIVREKSKILKESNYRIKHETLCTCIRGMPEI